MASKACKDALIRAFQRIVADFEEPINVLHIAILVDALKACRAEVEV